ncbi:MAG: isocitrate lyase/phosphoenolpyruvate mutase family protein [SAR324 cluster bacterium]|nr:isocitrate lyase/phosphoenolpyruvate mutase family protein [SAR324 cluster bacterium]
MTMIPSLKQQLVHPDIVLAPGIYDALGALLAQEAGFSTLYLSGASIAYSKFASPDIGLVSMNEVAATISSIKERINLPLIVDADTGFGNAMNVARTVRLFERYGANAIQLEDQELPKRCGHLDGKRLVSGDEMSGKIKAATDAREDVNTLIIARTDAIAVEGFESALERVYHYYEAGADILFIEAPTSLEQMKTINSRFASKVPLLANMVEGGKTPFMSSEELQKLGYSLVIFPGGLARSFAFMARQYFNVLKREGSTESFQNMMLDFKELNSLLGTEKILEKGKSYQL